MRSYPSHVTFIVEIKNSLAVSVYKLLYFRVILVEQTFAAVKRAAVATRTVAPFPATTGISKQLHCRPVF